MIGEIVFVAIAMFNVFGKVRVAVSMKDTLDRTEGLVNWKTSRDKRVNRKLSHACEMLTKQLNLKTLLMTSPATYLNNENVPRHSW